MYQKLLTQELLRRIPRLYSVEKEKDPMIHVKFFTPDGQWTWYGMEYDGKDLFFGYVEGLENELGYFSMSELKKVKGNLGLGIERDMHFKPCCLSKIQQH